MGEVVDARPDRFLRVMRDTGDWSEACSQSGMTTAEVEDLCRVNVKFDRARLECQLEYHEEQLIQVTEAGIAKMRANLDARVEKMKKDAWANFEEVRANYG